ncbi:unnamed protein product, partial [Ectocarpus sp. 12 AP-2014]
MAGGRDAGAVAGKESGDSASAPRPAFKKRAAGGKNFRRRGKPGRAEKASANNPAGKDDNDDDAAREARRNEDGDDKNKEAEEKSAGSDGTNKEIVDKKRSEKDGKE